MEPWQRLTTGDLVTEQIQDNILPIVNAVQDSAILDGVLIKNQTIRSAYYTYVPHGLSRAPRGWIAVRVRGPSFIFDDQDNNADSSKSLKLRSSFIDAEVDLWVF